MKILPARKASLNKTASDILKNKARYQMVEQGLLDQKLYVPWWFIAIAHIRESDGDFSTQLAQGDPLNQVSHNDPAGRGPFVDHPGEKYDAFTRGCFDALIDCAPHSAKNTDWSPGGTMTQFEMYNGLGYAGMGKPSPYVWSGTDQYSHGKYVADHDYRDNVVDTQPGCAALLYLMMQQDSTIKFGEYKMDINTTVSTVDTGVANTVKNLWTKDFTNLWSGITISAGTVAAVLPTVASWLGSPAGTAIEASLGLTPYMGIITAAFGLVTYLAKGRQTA